MDIHQQRAENDSLRGGGGKKGSDGNVLGQAASEKISQPVFMLVCTTVDPRFYVFMCV